MTKKYTVAKEVDIEQIDATPRFIPRYKALVNEDKLDQVFAIVGRDYKVALHQEVVDAVETTLSDLKLESTGNPEEYNEGARLNIVKKFPNIGMQIENEFFNLTITVDNSYDLTTGLRVVVGAVKRDTNTQCFIPDRFANLYHKHTKGMMIDDIRGSVHKGISVFQNKIREDFERMVATPIDPTEASIKFDDLSSEDSKSLIPKKYLEEVKKAVDEKQPTTQWRLYKLVMETLAPLDFSLERRRQVTLEFVKVVRSLG